jgi:ATP-dependent protease ClpP protease subunit
MRNIAYTLLLLVSSVCYGKEVLLTTTNTVTIRGEINDESMQKAKLDLMKLYAQRGFSKYKIYVVLDSGGGSIDAGEDFIQMAKQLRDVETITIFAASMASGIVQALPGSRYITGNGTMMFHRAYARIEGQFNEGELESRLRLSKRIVGILEQRNADRLKLDLNSYKTLVKDEYWIYADEAVQKNAADEVVDVRCSNELINQTTTQKIRMLIFEGEVTFSGCPVLRTPM